MTNKISIKELSDFLEKANKFTYANKDAPKSNSTVFWFFIDNTEDSVSLDVINNITIYENQTIYVNATDDDLLVTQKSIKNEFLTFKSNTSWVNISTYTNSSNYVTAKININFETNQVLKSFKPL